MKDFLQNNCFKTFNDKQKSKEQLNSKLKSKKQLKLKKFKKEPKVITLWDKIENLLNQEWNKLKIKKKHLNQELISYYYWNN